MNDEGIITLTDNDGNDCNFGFLDFIEYDENEYIVLYPLQGDDERLLILKVEEDATSEEYDSYVGIDDDDLVDKIYQLFLEKHKDELE